MSSLSLDHGFDIGHGPTLSAWIGEVGAVVRQHGVDLVRDCLDQGPQEVGRNAPRAFSCNSVKANFEVRSIATKR